MLLCCQATEKVSKVIMEGSASGCVAIVSNVPGCSDAVVDGKTGFTVAKRSVPALVDAISYCVEIDNDFLYYPNRPESMQSITLV